MATGVSDGLLIDVPETLPELLRDSPSLRSGLTSAAPVGALRATWHRLPACDDRGLEAGDPDEARATGESSDVAGDCLVAPTDVTCEDSVRGLFDLVRERYGRLDVLFNNAGVNVPATPVEELSLADWQRVVSTNLTGVFLCTREAVRMMKAQDPIGGRIINNGSVSATTPRPHSLVYTATKHAVNGITKSTNLDGRRFNIACGQIDIGNTETDMAARMKHGVLQADGETRVEPTFDVQHVADTVAYLASLPLDVNVPFITVMATGMPMWGRG